MTLLCNKLKSSYSGVSYLAVNEKTKLRVAHGAEAFGRRPCLAVRVTLHTYRDNNKAKQTTRKINLKPNPNKETRKEGKVQETNKVENFLSNKQRHITHTANAPVTALCMLCEPVRRFSPFFFLLPFVILLSQGNEKRRERTEALLLIFATPRLSNSTRSLSLSLVSPSSSYCEGEKESRVRSADYGRTTAAVRAEQSQTHQHRPHRVWKVRDREWDQ